MKINDADFIVPTSLITNVQELHEFLYGETDYQPSREVQAASDRILGIAEEATNSGGYLEGVGGEKALMWNYEEDSYDYDTDDSGNSDYSEDYDTDSYSDEEYY